MILDYVSDNNDDKDEDVWLVMFGDDKDDDGILEASGDDENGVYDSIQPRMIRG